MLLHRLVKFGTTRCLKFRQKFKQINSCIYRKIKEIIQVSKYRDRLNNIFITNQSHRHTSQLAKRSTLQIEVDCSVPYWGISGYFS